MNNEELRGFKGNGVDLSVKNGQGVGDCPFCESENKFYVNVETLLWDCKKCGKSGNFPVFLGEMAKIYKSQINNLELGCLAEHRKLPVEAFDGLQIGYNGAYRIPVYSSKLACQDIRSYKIGGRIFGTAGCKTGLYQGYRMPKERVIYLCEGEWDTIAMRYLLNKLKKEGLAVGVPGALTFKDEWVEWFRGKFVRVLYDNDETGLEGSERVLQKLKGVAGDIRFLHWPKGTEDGYDINNLVTDYKGKYRKCYKKIHSYLEKSSHNKASVEIKKNLKPISAQELIDKYKKWLHLPNSNVLKVLYGSVIANRIGGDPVWMFFVAPPGGSKSELLMSLSESIGMKAVTSLTPHTLISGMRHADGKDPSLLANLDKKILIIKDFTTILSMNQMIRDEIFGTLRDAYDGATEKIFGNGLVRTYNAKFGIIAGVTNVIESFSAMHSSLGERFLKFRITGNWDLASEKEKIIRTLANIGNEVKMRTELKETAQRYLDNFILPENMPRIEKDIQNRVIALAQFTARMRGYVDRDRFSGTVNYKPSSEVGTRLAKQLMQLGIGIAIFLDKYMVTEKVFDLIRQVALNSIPDRTEDVVHGMYKIPGETGTPEISHESRLPKTTVYKVLQDLVLLKIVTLKEEKGKRPTWKLSQGVRQLIDEGRIYPQHTKEK